MSYETRSGKTLGSILATCEKGIIPTDHKVLADYRDINRYLDIPILGFIGSHKWDQCLDILLPLHQLRGWEIFKHGADDAAQKGQLETLKWIRSNGGEWTCWAANGAAGNGKLETLKYIMANGGKWSSWAADLAAGNGQLETLKWITANGGEWSRDIVNYPALSGQLETLKWIMANGGQWTSVTTILARQNNQAAILKWITVNGPMVTGK